MSHTQKIYIAGPMTGLPGYNYPAFNEVAAMLRAQGYLVENPAENPEPACGTWQGYMRNALAQLVKCDTIYILAGWMGSKGARIEARTAYDLGLCIQFAPDALLEKPGVHSIRELIQHAADQTRNATWKQVRAMNDLLNIAAVAGRHDVVSKATNTLRDLLNCTIRDYEPIYIDPLKTEPVAEICSASHDDAAFCERAIAVLRDISNFDYGTKLVAVPKTQER